ncbi:hypothetical protein Glove_120g79 [Diversispora epigaea]|uniref:Uncharacterized protein n=1 Tax=Diversispora epigaea TaxID=1348612 RepID=A0A397J8T6_9GLOM|nr:hypothetical protein Glove_120g79 [Diversispora epigaea]
MSRAEHNIDIDRRFRRTGEHNALDRVINAERPYDSIGIIFEGENMHSMDFDDMYNLDLTYCEKSRPL